MFRITPMVKNLLIINIGLALLQGITSVSLGDLFALRVVFSDYFQPYQIFTYMWLHAPGYRHILGNMLILFFAGPMLENMWGAKKFLIFYLACGIGGGVLFGVADFIEKKQIVDQRDSFYANPDPESFRIFVLDYGKYNFNISRLDQISNNYYDEPENETYIASAKEIVGGISSFYINGTMVGASGAIFGILMAMLILFPNALVYIYFLFPVKVKYLVTVLLIYEVYAEMNRSEGDTVAHLAHLGGAAIAYIIIKYWGSQSNRFY